MKTLNDITFGLTVTTTYNGTSGNITAKMKHGVSLVTRASVHYDHALSSNENHFQAAIACLNKVAHEHDKQFEVIAYSYNEKETGYNFICQRQF